MIDLGTLGGAERTASAISSDGKIVGWSHERGRRGPSVHLDAGHAERDGGRMVDLGSLNGADGFPTGVNAAGQVVWHGGDRK